ncbi:methyl-accepting chemotaxis protein [Oricola sp.]|uniref:methyl-accepting chemotaxis protein n=1 Tax=Oricola sp. TaxID=1979950 RepID=UPI003BAC42C9
MTSTATSKSTIDQDIPGRLSFLGLDEAGLEKLRKIKPIIERELPIGLDKFYETVRRTPEASQFFRDDSHMSGAKNEQIGHWESIAAGRFDDRYVEKVRTIGSVHARIGLAPRWYIGGYGVLTEALIHGVLSEYWPSKSLFGKQNASAQEVGYLVVSLVKAILLDMDLSISVYIDEAEEAKKIAQAEAIESEREVVIDSFGKAMERIAARDLSYRVQDDLPEAYDKLKSDFNNALEALSTTIGSISDSAEQIAGGSREIRAAADDMSKRAEQQAAAVEETAAAVEEITATVKSSAERAEESGSLVVRTKDNAEKSGVVVREAVEAMDRINKSSDEIANIIAVIDDIAFQTNLLALNAGVEAARAGDAGKGFAVVAQEVRELAQRSAGAAKEIKDLITSSGDAVKSGVALVNKTGEALESIVGEVQEINENVQAIIEAARQQSGGLQEINTSVSSIDKGTQQNAAMAEELTANSHALSDEVSTINTKLSDFQVTQGARRPKAVSAGAEPKRSPARDLGKKVANAFATHGNAAVENWEEF